MTVEGIKHPQRKLKPAARQDIYLIFKEAITNIQKHSNATKVIIHITETQKGTQLFLSNNGSTMGKGKSTGLGLDNIKMRVAALKGSIVIDHKTGFHITIALPFKL
jgi:signal transduction histidine kinase